jgi:hypothetical protein
VDVLGEAVDHYEDDRLAAHLGKALMKSMEISAHTCDGTSSGCNTPAGHRVSVLLRWHVSHERTQS